MPCAHRLNAWSWFSEPPKCRVVRRFWEIAQKPGTFNRGPSASQPCGKSRRASPQNSRGPRDRELTFEALEPRWLLSIGDLDVRCGVNSKVVTDFFGSGQDSIRAMALQPDGKIVVVGQTDSSCGIVGYQPDGHLDTSFGTGGRVVAKYSPSAQARDAARALVLQPDGKIIVVGETNTTGSGPTLFGLLRLNLDGSLDPTIGTEGRVQTNFPASVGGDYARGVALQGDGRIVVAGSSKSTAGSYDITLRCRPERSRDLWPLRVSPSVVPRPGTSGRVTLRHPSLASTS